MYFKKIETDKLALASHVAGLMAAAKTRLAAVAAKKRKKKLGLLEVPGAVE